MSYKLERRQIETEILKMYALSPDCERRWSEIRNHLWLAMNVPPNFNKSTFNVNLTRSLSELVKEGFLRNINEGHKNMKYALEPRGLERVIRHYKADPMINFTLLGTYKIGDSYAMFKKKAMKKLEELLEIELKKHYEEAKRYAEKIAEGHNSAC